MLDLRYELKAYIEKYRGTIVAKMNDPDTESDEEADLHTDFIHRCSKGDLEARRYVITKVKEQLMGLVTLADRKIIRDIIFSQLLKFQNNEFERIDLSKIDFANEEAFITYYQLIEDCGSEAQKKFLSKEIETVDELEVLAIEIYKIEYGLSLAEELMYMRINNIEIHGSKKIRVENYKGIWYTIKDYHFETEEEVARIADRLYSQEGNGEITEENCEKEGRLLNGARLTITLSPGASDNSIYIKKFDSFNVSKEEMINNGTLTEEILDDLSIFAKGRANGVIIGGVNSGKSTFVKVFAGLFPKNYKLGLVDSGKDTDLESLYPDRDIRTLYETDLYSLDFQFKKMLRMNRDIIIIGESRGIEILEMLKAMTRANSGSFCTLHITNPKIVVNAISQMCLEDGNGQDINVIRERVSEAVDLIIRLRHFQDTGERVLDYMGELVVNYNNPIRPFEIRHIYQWDSKAKRVVRNPNYIMSEELEEKLRYYGCSDEEIAKLKRKDENA